MKNTNPAVKMVALTLLLAITMLTLIENTHAADKKQPSKQSVVFWMREMKISVLHPAGRLVTAKCKPGHDFAIVATREVLRAKKFSTEEMDYVLVDENGKEFKPIGFGFPFVTTKSPMTYLGPSFKGDVEIVDVEKTLLGLFFIIPTQATKLRIKGKDGAQSILAVSPKFAVPDEYRIPGARFYGRLDMKTPSLPEDGWELE